MERKENYAIAVKTIKTAILQGQYAAAKGTNRIQLATYFAIGKYISQNSRHGFWGKGAIETISEQLRRELPGLRGYSPSNMKNMRLFYEKWRTLGVNSPIAIGELQSEDYQIDIYSALNVDTVVDFPVDVFFSVPFTHHIRILEKTQTQEERYYLHKSLLPNISYHFKRIFASGELDAQTVIKEILITAQSGVRGVSEEKIRYYNLDVILSLGYRVNSVQATAFRKWATSVLKQYMIKGYAVNHNAVSEQKYEDLKRALGLLENVFGQNLIMAEQQAKELFAVVKVTSADTLLIFPTIAYSITIPELLRGLSL